MYSHQENIRFLSACNASETCPTIIHEHWILHADTSGVIVLVNISIFKALSQ